MRINMAPYRDLGQTTQILANIIKEIKCNFSILGVNVFGLGETYF